MIDAGTPALFSRLHMPTISSPITARSTLDGSSAPTARFQAVRLPVCTGESGMPRLHENWARLTMMQQRWSRDLGEPSRTNGLGREELIVTDRDHLHWDLY